MAEPPKRARKKAAMPPGEAEAEHETGGADALLQAFGWSLPVATVIAAGTMGFFYGVGTAILTLAGGVLLGVITILWASVRTLSGEAPITLEEAVALGAPTAAEEQKRAVLQALKDLEYERSVGKIAEGDYEELLSRYRSEAKRLLRAVDVDMAPLRARAIAYLAERIAPPEKGKNTAPADPERDERACPSCQTANDGDALFCKKCGSKLATTSKDRKDATV